jgi:hypothetical protein
MLSEDLKPPPEIGVDTVAHCGYTISGDYYNTMQYLDIATIWACLAGRRRKS